MTRRVLLPLLVAAVVTVPSMRNGAILDDWMHVAIINDHLLDREWWDLFHFADGVPAHSASLISSGAFPWFTNPELKLRFFRPLSSALIVFDVKTFGEQFWLAHLHTTLWYVALVAIVAALFRRVMPAVALVAALLFAVDDSHVIPVLWLANRNAVLAVTFAWLGLLFHLRWREAGWKPAPFLIPVCTGLALLSGETAVGALAYVFTYELLGRREDSPAVRVRALLPTAVPLLAFIVLYKVLHMGAKGSATYIDPVSQPFDYLKALPARFLASFGGQSVGLPPDLWIFLPQARPVLIASGVVALVLWPLAWRRWAPGVGTPERRTLSWLVAGGLLAMLPPLSTFPSARLLIGPSLGLAALTSTLLVGAWKDTGWRRGLGLFWLGLAFALQPVTNWVTDPATFKAIGERTTRAVTAIPAAPGQHLMVVASTDLAPAVFGVPAMAVAHQPLPKTWHVWSMAPLAHTLKALTEREFEMTVRDGHFLESTFEQNFRSCDTHPFAVGDRVDVEGMRVDVLEVDEGAPQRFRITLSEPLERYRFVAWNGDVMAPFTLPAPGQSLDIPRAPTMFETLVLPAQN